MNEEFIAQLMQRKANERIIDGADVSEHTDKSLPELVDEEKPQEDNAIVEHSQSSDDSELEDDFETARHNLRELAREGADSLATLNHIAEQSQHPRAYEVMATLLKNLSSVNAELLDLHDKKEKVAKQRRQRREDEGESNETTQVNQTYNDNRTVFQGSTAEMAEMVKRQRRGEDDE